MKLLLSIAFVLQNLDPINEVTLLILYAYTKLFQTLFDPPLVSCPLFPVELQRPWTPHILQHSAQETCVWRLTLILSDVRTCEEQLDGWFWTCLSSLKVLSDSTGMESGHCLKLSAHDHLYLLFLMVDRKERRKEGTNQWAFPTPSEDRPPALNANSVQTLEK